MSSPFTTRWMIRQDLPHLAIFESELNDAAWNRDDFLAALQDRKVVGFTATIKTIDKPIGYVLYHLESSRITIKRIHVDSLYRRAGAGTLLIEKLMEKLSVHKRRRMRIDVPEVSFDVQLFLRKLGFRATLVLPRSERYRFVFPCIQQSIITVG